MAVLLIGACWLAGLGLAWLGNAGEWYELWLGVLGVSAGMACFYPILTSLQLLTKPTQRAGSALGRLKSLGPLSAIVAAVLIHVAEPAPGIRNLLVVVGTSVVLGGTLAGLIIGRGRVVLMHGRLRIKSRLWPYYLLNFLAGCRSALFKSFAIFLLVSMHGFELQGTALLVVTGSLLTFVGYNVIGRLVEPWGRRTVLSRRSGAVTLIFLGFAFCDSASFLVVLYCLDSLLFGASVVTEAHLRRASPSSDLVGDVAAGLTLFSLASLFMPFVAGNVWSYAGREATFLLGSLMSGPALLASRSFVVRCSSIEADGQN
jgi:hypothetical protein